MAAHLSLQVIAMGYSNALSSPMLTTLHTRDSRRETRLTEKIQTLNAQINEQFQRQPTFRSFVQDAFNQSFNTLATPLDLTKTFLRIDPAPTAHGANTTTTARQDASTPLLPTLLDAVVERLVTRKSAHYAGQPTHFHLTSDGRDDGAVQGLTPQAFDRFLDTFTSTLAVGFKTYVEHFWNAPIGPHDTQTCKQWLAEKRLDVMRAEAELLKLDGVLDVASELLLLRVMGYPDAASRRALNGYRPCAYGLAVKDKLSRDIPLYGAFVLTARDQDDDQVHRAGEEPPPQVRDITPQANVGSVLLFLPNSGFEAFDSLASLDRELHRRLNDPQAFTDILGLMGENDRASGLAFHQQQIASGQFRYIERLESIFLYSQDSLHERTQADFTWMVTHYQRQAATLDAWLLPASLDRVTDFTRAFDVGGVLIARHTKKLRRQLQQFLKEASRDDQQTWAHAVKDYTDELQGLTVSEGLPSLSQFSDPSVLLSYSNEQLRQRLIDDHSLAVDPDTLIIHTKTYALRPTGSYVPGGKPHPSEPGTPVYTQRALSLTELALENVEWLDLNLTHFSRLTDTEQKPYSALTMQQIKDLVRSVNIGNSYEQFLKKRLISSDEAQAEQDRYVRCMALQLRVDAIEAKIAGDFLPDRLDRGYMWVMSALAGPVDDDKRPTVEEHRIMVSRLKLRGERVRGVLVFSTATQSVASLVVYTPGAANGRLFHEYADASAMHRDFINHAAWRDYLTARVELSARPRIQRLLKGGATETVIALSRIADHFLEEAYQAEASAVINDANAQSTSTQETNLESATTVLTAALDFATLFFPVKVMLPVGLSRSLLSIINAVEAAQLGDRAAAAWYVVRALGEMVGAVLDGVMGAARVTPTGTAIGRGRAINPMLALRKKPEGISPLAGWAGQQIYVQDTVTPGTYEAPRHFLLENKRWYSIRRDNDAQVWRLRDPRRAPSAYKGDPLYRTAQGVWEIRSPYLGLRGGNSYPTQPERALIDLFPHLDQQQARRVFESFDFPVNRVLEHQMQTVLHLRLAPDQLDTSFTYLRISQERFWARLRGTDLPGSHAAGTIDPAPGPHRPPAPPTVTQRPAAERFLEWGQAFEHQAMTAVPGRPGIWRRSNATPSQALQDYIKIGEHYYAILPGDTVVAVQGAKTVITPTNRPHSTFAQFEDVLANANLEQPRIVEYNAQLDNWLVVPQVPFPRPLTRHMSQMFPLFTPHTLGQLSQRLFDRANPLGLNANGFAHLIKNVHDWRAWTKGVDAALTEQSAVLASDPLALMPTLSRGLSPFEWSLDVSNQFELIRFNTEGLRPTLMANLLERTTNTNTKMLMKELLVGSHYEVFDSAFNSELVFRRPGQPTVYWMTLRNTDARVLSSRKYNPEVPTSANLRKQQAPMSDMLVQARNTGNLQLLIGGVQRSGQAQVSPFIFRP